MARTIEELTARHDEIVDQLSAIAAASPGPLDFPRGHWQWELWALKYDADTFYLREERHKLLEELREAVSKSPPEPSHTE